MTTNTSGLPPYQVVGAADPAYPALLKEIDDAPSSLFIIGDPALLTQPQLAIVGSRNATASGLDIARTLAAELTQLGFTVTSGLALGIDAAAHSGALAAGGHTLAVLGSGIDQIYPRRHAPLARRLVEHGGALVSELPPGTPPRRFQFPRRNRIIAGLSVGTLVVEAAARSGSLITARLAAEQGREVFAVPGSIRNPMARGCHALLRNGAKLVESTNDILEELASLLGAQGPARQDQQKTSPALTDDKVLSALGFEPVTIDTLVARTGLSAQDVSARILVLELEGHVESDAGGLYARIR